MNFMINHLTIEDILKIHNEIQETYSDKSIHYEVGCLEKRIVEPQTSYFGEDQYPRLFQKASLYLYKLIISHCLSDGNKRLGLYATEYFLNSNGYDLIATDDELYEFVLSIANHETRPSLDYVEDWLYYHSTEYQY